jgi:hypothetical protein
MKFSSTISLALAGTAMAAGAADTINQVLSDITTAMKSFDSTIKSYTGGDSKSLVDAAGKIQQLTEGGAAKIAAGADLTLNDAVSITTTVQGLQGNLDSTLSNLEGIGPALAKAGGCGTWQSSLSAQGAAAQKLQEAITQKAPAETKPIAQQLGGKIGASIANTQSKFKDICAGAPSGGSSTGGSSTGGGAMGGDHGSHTSATGSSPTKASKSATSSAALKPAMFTAGASHFTACGALAVGAAILAL